jgi:hypothetical protein
MLILSLSTASYRTGSSCRYYLPPSALLLQFDVELAQPSLHRPPARSPPVRNRAGSSKPHLPPWLPCRSSSPCSWYRPQQSYCSAMVSRWKASPHALPVRRSIGSLPPRRAVLSSRPWSSRSNASSNPPLVQWSFPASIVLLWSCLLQSSLEPVSPLTLILLTALASAPARVPALGLIVGVRRGGA